MVPGAHANLFIVTNLFYCNMFFFIRYNGFLPQGERGRKRSKFVLSKRKEANGVKKSKHYVVKTPHSSQAILDVKQHSISYTLSRNHAVIVEYTPDEDMDMFQVCMHIKHTNYKSVYSTVNII